MYMVYVPDSGSHANLEAHRALAKFVCCKISVANKNSPIAPSGPGRNAPKGKIIPGVFMGRWGAHEISALFSGINYKIFVQGSTSMNPRIFSRSIGKRYVDRDFCVIARVPSRFYFAFSKSGSPGAVERRISGGKEITENFSTQDFDFETLGE